MLKDKLTNWLAAAAIAISAFLGVSSALNLKIPSNVTMLLAALSSGLGGVTSFATGKDDNLKAK
jgi:hypothetical protein